MQALSGAFVAPATLPNTDQLVTDYDTASSNGAANVVSLALINYASIKPDALTLGLLTTSNGQLFNVICATSPYITNSLFMAAGGS